MYMYEGEKNNRKQEKKCHMIKRMQTKVTKKQMTEASFALF